MIENDLKYANAVLQIKKSNGKFEEEVAVSAEYYDSLSEEEKEKNPFFSFWNGYFVYGMSLFLYSFNDDSSEEVNKSIDLAFEKYGLSELFLLFYKIRIVPFCENGLKEFASDLKKTLDKIKKNSGKDIFSSMKNKAELDVFNQFHENGGIDRNIAKILEHYYNYYIRSETYCESLLKDAKSLADYSVIEVGNVRYFEKMIEVTNTFILSMEEIKKKKISEYWEKHAAEKDELQREITQLKIDVEREKNELEELKKLTIQKAGEKKQQTKSERDYAMAKQRLNDYIEELNGLSIFKFKRKKELEALTEKQHMEVENLKKLAEQERLELDDKVQKEIMEIDKRKKDLQQKSEYSNSRLTEILSLYENAPINNLEIT